MNRIWEGKGKTEFTKWQKERLRFRGAWDKGMKGMKPQLYLGPAQVVHVISDESIMPIVALFTCGLV